MSGGPGATRATPTGVALAAGLPLLLGGVIPLSVTLMASNPHSTWTPWLVLTPAALFVIAIFSFAARAIRQAHRVTPEGTPETQRYSSMRQTSTCDLRGHDRQPQHR
jgi:hypothetical protein